MNASITPLRNLRIDNSNVSNTLNRQERSGWERIYPLPESSQSATIYRIFPRTPTRVTLMADDVTREELDAKFRAAAAEGDTKIARMEGKLDLVLSKIDGLNVRFEDARNDAREARATAHADNAATRANIWVVGLGLAIVIVAVAALLPVFFSIGAQVRDLVHSEIQTQTAPPARH